MTVKNCLLPLLLCGLPFMLCSGSEIPGELMTEDFDNYGYYTQNFNAGVSVSEEPASLKRLYINPEQGKTVTALKQPLLVPLKNRQENVTVSFRVMFFGSVLNKQTEALLYFADNKQLSPRQGFEIVNVNLDGEKGGSFSGAVGKQAVGALNLTSRETSYTPYFSNQWYDVEIVVHDGAMILRTKRDLWVTESINAAPAGMVPAGINFKSSMPVMISNVRFTSNPSGTLNPGFRPVKAPDLPENFLNRVEDGASASYHAGKGILEWTSNAKQEEFQFMVTDLGFPSRMILNFEDEDGRSISYHLKSFSQNVPLNRIQNVPAVENGKLVYQKKIVSENVPLHDSGIQISGPEFDQQIFTVPRISGRYEKWQMREIAALALTGKFDRASEANFIFRVVKEGKICQLWINSNYVGDVPLYNNLKKVTAMVPPCAKVVTALNNFTPVPVQDRLFFSAIPEQDFTRWLKLAGTDSAIFARNIENSSFDTAVCRENLGSYALECDGYLSRSAFDGLGDFWIRQVPRKQYIQAHVICSLGENHPDKSTDVTARLTLLHDGGGVSPRIAAISTVTLPRNFGDPIPSNVTRLKNGDFRVIFDLDVGSIQDLIFYESKWNYLQIEVLGGLYEKNNYYLSRENKPALHPSNVHVKSVELTETPASFMVDSANVGNVFFPGEPAFMTAKTQARVPGEYLLKWQVCSVDGKILEEKEIRQSFKNPDDSAEIPMNFSQKELGHYDVFASWSQIVSDTVIPLVKWKGAFSRLENDTRKAGYESPFGTWNFNGAHGSPGGALFGRINKILGTRRITGGWKSEKDCEEYGFTLSHFSYLRGKGNTPEQRQEDLDRQIQDLISRYPHVRTAMIFHESGGGPIPMELLGGKTEITPEQVKKDEQRVQSALELARAWRRNAPHIQLVVGNSGESLGLLAQLFRQKYPADMIDRMGEESCGMTKPPERSVAYANWQLLELARIYGYDKLRPEACYEWKGRVLRDFNSPRDHAQIRVRDLLIALAWEMNLVALNGQFEVKNSYYNTVWGEGVVSRYPLAQPYPQFTAQAVLTRILDCAKFIRMVPTGSYTVYALEFKQEKNFVYALWTPCGEVSVKLDFNGTPVKRIGFYGEESTFTEGNAIITKEPCYFVSASPVKQIAAAMTRTYPDENFPGRENAVVATPMDNAGDWYLSEGQDKRLEPPLDTLYLSALCPGKFSLKQVKDEEKGDCLEITLIPKVPRTDIMQEYGMIRMRKPAVINGTPDTVGIWVKGNSTWGKIYLELEDADGEIWISSGTGGYGCPVYDWPEHFSLNFDGWRFMQFPLTGKSPVKIQSPGENQWQWSYERTGDGKLTYPVKVRGVGFSMTRKVLNLLKMEEAGKSIRFRDFSAY